MFRKAIALITTVVIVFTLLCFTAAADGSGAKYLYTYSCASYLSISGSTATCASDLKGYYGTTTKIEVTQTLQVKDGNQWRTSKTWSNTYYSHNCHFVNTKTIYSGNIYRVKSEYKVYAGSNYETVYSYSASVTT